MCDTWPATGRPGRLLPVLALTWIVVPTATLLAYSELRNPIYYRGTCPSPLRPSPWLVGLCVVALGRSRIGVAMVLACFTVAAAPTGWPSVVRTQKENMDYSAVADLIERNAAPGDCLCLTIPWPGNPGRSAHTAARPNVYRKLRDHGRGLDRSAAGALVGRPCRGVGVGRQDARLPGVVDRHRTRPPCPSTNAARHCHLVRDPDGPISTRCPAGSDFGGGALAVQFRAGHQVRTLISRPSRLPRVRLSVGEAEPRGGGTSRLFSRTMTGSPTLTVSKYHSASSRLRPTQPWRHWRA